MTVAPRTWWVAKPKVRGTAIINEFPQARKEALEGIVVVGAMFLSRPSSSPNRFGGVVTVSSEALYAMPHQAGGRPMRFAYDDLTKV